MKETHYKVTKNGQVQIRRKSDHGIAFRFRNNENGRMKATMCLHQLHIDYDATFYRFLHYVESTNLVLKNNPILPEHFPDSN